MMLNVCTILYLFLLSANLVRSSHTRTYVKIVDENNVVMHDTTRRNLLYGSLLYMLYVPYCTMVIRTLPVPQNK